MLLGQSDHRPGSQGRLPCSRAGPFTHRVLLTLEEKQIPYVKHYVNTHDKPEWYVELCDEQVSRGLKIVSPGH